MGKGYNEWVAEEARSRYREGELDRERYRMIQTNSRAESLVL